MQAGLAAGLALVALFVVRLAATPAPGLGAAAACVAAAAGLGWALTALRRFERENFFYWKYDHSRR